MMKKIQMRIVALFAGLAVGNVLAACITGEWLKCVDRISFQFLALGMLFIFNWMDSQLE